MLLWLYTLQQNRSQLADIMLVVRWLRATQLTRHLGGVLMCEHAPVAGGAVGTLGWRPTLRRKAIGYPGFCSNTTGAHLRSWTRFTVEMQPQLDGEPSPCLHTPRRDLVTSARFF